MSAIGAFLISKSSDQGKVKARESEEKKGGNALAGKRGRRSRSKVVRATFTLPPREHEGLELLQRRALAFGLAANRSQLVRAGLQLLREVDRSKLAAILADVKPVPTGRPPK